MLACAAVAVLVVAVFAWVLLRRPAPVPAQPRHDGRAVMPPGSANDNLARLSEAVEDELRARGYLR